MSIVTAFAASFSKIRITWNCSVLPQEATGVVKEGGFAAIFDSQTENFLSQKGQSTKSTETKFC